MSTLHLVRQSAFATNDFAQCLSVLDHQDSIVLMDDGCYNLKHSLMDSLIKRVDGTININVISSHAQARAIETLTEINHIEMSDVVELTFNHKKVITWQ
ncbi:sulfurtransferase complex subunit TusB [Colwellia psychrerythraea]|uniref:Sulfur relay protein TusB/DsrH n=1 Tax=Colwellia psychrerythraea TaxID=28229 RepID=A0A099KDM2_COLPS|nr:sulfurtransferase complex subunit TusB [Colwellia psychrerythraea]KGJ87648.1 sulfur relay protein TusB/DsrH [Colwellia psychrerythraea]